ncbi:hypothetical protein FRB99_008682 [Tulasnella sp. 403]|nr:hypothetical protein FRB99_008682 [Tulasnella sp. 403]
MNKTDDSKWVAEYASACMAGNALRWHARLDPSIRKDWSLLQIALLDEFPAGSGGARSVSIPSAPAAASIPTTPARGPGILPSSPIRGFESLSLGSIQTTGRIRVLSTNSTIGKYVSRLVDAKWGIFRTCEIPSEALQVKLVGPLKQRRYNLEILV